MKLADIMRAEPEAEFNPDYSERLHVPAAVDRA